VVGVASIRARQRLRIRRPVRTADDDTPNRQSVDVSTRVIPKREYTVKPRLYVRNNAGTRTRRAAAQPSGPVMGVFLSNASAPVAADPAPLGLAAFGGTTLMLSLMNAGVDPTLIRAVVPTAFLFGGVIQLVAGIAEFRQGGTFGATGFSAFAGFWLSFAAFEQIIAPRLPGNEVHVATGLLIIPWAVIAFYMTIATLRTSGVLMAVFAGSTCTLTSLSIAGFLNSDALTLTGGAFGLFTAVAALYGSFAGLINTWGRHLIPTLPDPGKRLAHVAHRRPPSRSITSSVGDHEPVR
jgi:succinate-acetate transporter protein